MNCLGGLHRVLVAARVARNLVAIVLLEWSGKEDVHTLVVSGFALGSPVLY